MNMSLHHGVNKLLNIYFAQRPARVRDASGTKHKIPAPCPQLALPPVPLGNMLGYD